MVDIVETITEIAPERVDRLWWLLFIMSKMGGDTDAGDWKGNWINAFCDDFEDDTFNLAIDRGLIRSTHDSDTDHSVAWLTDAGKALVAYFDKPPAESLRTRAEAAEERCAELEAALKPFSTLAPVILAEAPQDSTTVTLFIDCEGTHHCVSLHCLRQIIALSNKGGE